MSQTPYSSILSYLKNPSVFSETESLITTFSTSPFHSLSLEQKYQKIQLSLFTLIKEAPVPSFLLSSVLHFINRINEEKIFPLPLTFADFEFWLNQFSGLSFEENRMIRNKISGKHLPRSAYQTFFPIGMNKTYPGPHFVAAHLSPDIDTTVASFFGWLDAFSARVGSACHYWCLPGGQPDCVSTEIFKKKFGKGLFKYVARTDESISASGIDLISPKKSDKTPSFSVYSTTGINEIENKLQESDQLAVLFGSETDSFSLGTIFKNDVKPHGIGTISFRDFSCFEEVKMAPHLDLISVVDHHKSSIRTGSVPTAIIGDTQSCNILIAEQMFIINDTYNKGLLDLSKLKEQIQTLSTELNSTSQIRQLQSLLKQLLATEQNDTFYIHPQREFTEYLSFLYAILDDTDLLTKVSVRDVECIAQLLNRLKSISIGTPTEIISFDDIPKDANFAKIASQRILHQEDMYAIYKEIYTERELSVEKNLTQCVQGVYSNIFLDSKIQNKCARVGQTKLFKSNIPYFITHSADIRSVWVEKAKEVVQQQHDIHLHLHMISTITGAEEVYENKIGPYEHQDELWLWTDQTPTGNNYLDIFLNGFKNAIKGILDSLSIELIGKDTKAFSETLHHHFPMVPFTIGKEEQTETIAVLRYKAGAVNSRKAMISPFLPSR